MTIKLSCQSCMLRVMKAEGGQYIFVNVMLEARGMHSYKITVELLMKQKRLRAVLLAVLTDLLYR